MEEKLKELEGKIQTLELVVENLQMQINLKVSKTEILETIDQAQRRRSNF